MEQFSLKPAVPKYWLIATAGLVWMSAGAMLCRLSFGWLVTIEGWRGVALGSAGSVLALLAYLFLFSGIVRKNIERIAEYPEKGCIFAFQAWKSYLLILVMVGLGYMLKRSPVSREVLALVYSAMGGALILSGIRYAVHLVFPGAQKGTPQKVKGDSP